MARRILTSAAIVALALTCMWMWPRTELELPELARAQVIAIDHDEDRKPTVPLAVAEAGAPHPQSAIDLRARILARAHRDAASARDRPSPSEPAARAIEADRSALARTAAARGPGRAAADPDPEDGAPAIEGLQDRTGRMGPIVEQLNRDFLPLADECFTDARERDPSLAGMLAIEVSLVADAELGTIIEEVEVAAGNEVHDAELLECVRETSLSTILPSPGEDGLGSFVLTMPVAP